MRETSAFEEFWKHYPRRVGKLAALKAYAKARKLATPEQILAGVELYKRTKPQYADWCHAATWLNQGRWMDEPDTAVVNRRGASQCAIEAGPTARDLEYIAQWEREHGKVS